MLDQRRRRWANITQTLGQCIVFADIPDNITHTYIIMAEYDNLITIIRLLFPPLITYMTKESIWHAAHMEITLIITQLTYNLNTQSLIYLKYNIIL